MSKRTEFESEFERIKGIYFSAQETFYIVEELYSQDSTSHNLEIYTKNMSSFFYYCKIYFWRNTVIELSKLLNNIDNEAFNIIKFITKLKPNGYFKSLKFDEIFLESLLVKIDKKRTIIDNLILQRDKLYAHEDRNNKNVNNLTSFKDIKELLEICKELIQHITQKHFETHLQFDMINSPQQNLKYLFECISKGIETKEKEHIDIINSFNSK
ncbi:AbiU2 domain-containing protein [Empedobacter tilapiae]